MNKKECISCKVEKDIAEFNKNKNSKDGYKTYCRECASKQNRVYREKYREKINEKKRKDYWESKKYSEEKTLRELKENTRACNTCGLEKSITDFYKRGNGGFYSICKECHIETTNQYVSENPKRTRKGRVIREQRRRARKSKLINDFTEVEWQACIEYFKNDSDKQCAYCGKRTNKLTQDHFIPLSKGGHYTKTNIIPICFSCNTQKHNTDFYDWYETKDFYSVERLEKVEKYLNEMNQDNPEPSEAVML